MAADMICKYLTILVILISAAFCQQHTPVQQQQQQQSLSHQVPPQVSHQAQQSARTAHSGARWSRREQPISATTTAACDYKEVLTNLHDRVSLLVTLDEDQRTRLESISKKVTQFEASNLARLDSLAMRQIDFVKRLDTLELMGRLTKREMEDWLESEHQIDHQIKNKTDVARNINNDLNAQRRIRDVPQERGVDSVSVSQKLDALSTLLASTRAAIFTLQSSLESNVSRLMQETNKLNRRINNVQRRRTQVLHQQPPQPPQPQYFGYPSQVPQTYPHQLITSCAQGNPTTFGILRLQLSETSEPFYVRCDEEYMTGGWTIIQNRYTGDLNFERGWKEYKTGFGNLASEFFIGLDKLHALTSNAVHELMIILEDFDGEQRNASYNLFAIGNESESYAIKLLGEYTGTAGDAFSYHAGSKFSTFDNDNDGCVDCNCAQAHLGAWWYNWCEMSNLNGKYFEENQPVPTYRGIYWHDFHGANYSMKAVRMMIRPVVLEQENTR